VKKKIFPYDIPGRLLFPASGELQMVPEWGYHPASAPALAGISGFFMKKRANRTISEWIVSGSQRKMIIYLNACTVIHNEVNKP